MDLNIKVRDPSAKAGSGDDLAKAVRLDLAKTCSEAFGSCSTPSASLHAPVKSGFLLTY